MHTGLKIGSVSDIKNVCQAWAWQVIDQSALARVVASLLMTQFRIAKRIVDGVEAPLSVTATGSNPTVVDSAMKAEIVQLLQLPPFSAGEDGPVRKHRERRDSLLFEQISWIAARLQFGGNALVRNPHVKSTHQGLDGVVLLLGSATDAVKKVVVLEEKCTKDPQHAFRYEVLPLFKGLHNRTPGRLRECSAAIREVLDMANLGDLLLEKLAKESMAPEIMTFRAALSGPPSAPSMQELFDRYPELKTKLYQQRMGATLFPEIDFRLMV